ncbi:MAG TPA: outer membrane beta-barrel protein [Bacteroidales bacterium]|nr:outer membrane beta-barrel protein [Bacteroidales bacterium]
MNNKTDRYFRDRLGNFEQSPPDSAWDQIVTKLGNRNKKRAVMIFFRIAAGMAILISTGIGVYLISKNEGTISPGMVSQQSNSPAASNESNPADDNQSSNIISQAEKSGQEEKSSVNTLAKSNKQVDSESNPSDRSITSVTAQGNEKIEQSPVSSDSSEINENITDKLAENTTKITVTPVPDSIIRELQIPDHISGTVMTPEEATEILLAQNNNEDKIEKRDGRWTVGSEIAPLYSYRSINSPNFDNEVSSLNSSESGILAYAGGIRVAMNTGKRFSVQSGLYYSRYGMEINQVNTVASSNGSLENYKFIAASNSTGTIEGVISERSQSDITTEGAYFYQNDYKNGVDISNVKPLVQGDAENIQLKQYFDYFELPLILKYKIIDRKLDFSLSGGLVTNFLVGNAVNIINDGKSTRVSETSDINVINYLGSVGMGFEMPVSDNFSFTLEPRFRYYINPIDPSDISVHPYSFGFFGGINYKF